MLLLPAASIVQVDVKALLEVRVADEVIAAPAKACDQTNDAWYNFDSVVVRVAHRSLRTPYVEVRSSPSTGQRRSEMDSPELGLCSRQHQVNRTLNPEDCVMNTHVLMLDLPKYQTYSIPQRITTLVVRHRVRAMWHHGSALAPFILALQGHIQRCARPTTWMQTLTTPSVTEASANPSPVARTPLQPRWVGGKWCECRESALTSWNVWGTAGWRDCGT